MEKTGFTQKIGRLFRLALLVCLSCAVFTTQAQTARITLDLQHATLEQAMDKIKAQTRYLFINRDVEDLESRKVSVNVSNELITNVLDQLFTPFDIGYDIDGRSIFIYKQQAAETQPVTVTGRVTDAKGQPVVGASVIVRGTTVGVSTDTEGRFALEVPSPAASQTLEVSYLGYETAAVPVGSRTSFEVTLQESSSEIEQVVVTALGIKRQEKALSYNVQQVAASDITLVKDANFMNSLSGKVAGVTINASSSGVGGATKVVLRGNKSISQSSNALYVIDGIPMYNFGGGGGTEFDSRGATEAIADINPEDIESISVLTGAAAAALYGSEAANGAVMITTKKGEAGALKVTLTSNTEFLNPFVLPEFQNRYGTGLNGVRSGSNIYSWGERLAPSARYGYTPNDFFETGQRVRPLQLHVPQHLLFPARPAASGRFGELHLPAGPEHDQPGRLLEPAGLGVPLSAGRERIAYRNLRNTDKKRYMLSLSASYDILPWLNVTGRVRIDNMNSLYTQKLYASSNTTITDGGRNGHYTEARTYDSQTYADVMANINKTLGDDWSLQANLGASINNVKSDELSYRGPIQENGLPNVFNVFDLDDTKKRAEKTGWHDQTQSLFASVEVGWKQMLYLTVTGRNDWASQIAGSSSSSFFYPSVGLSWVPTSLWDLGGALNYLKLRGSIASVGMPFPRYLTVPTYEYDATNRVWKDKTHYPIGDLKPERTTTYEVGIDARLWRHLSLSASWYQADTKNQTFDPSLPPSSSYTTIYLQTGHVRNTGVELSVGYDNRWGSFRWATNFTYAWNRNEIIELAANAVNPVTGEPLNLEKLDIKGLGKAKYILKEGGTLGDLYTTSDLRFNDNGYVEVDKSGNLLLTDEGDDIYLGSVFPDHNLAWRNDFSWKGVNLGLLFTARIGGICYSATQANLDLYGVSEASAAARDAGGVLINGREMVDAQKWYQAIGSQSGLPQYYTYSATNFRLQELSLGYTLPAKWFRDRMRMTVSFVGRNLWMIYCKAPFDPEAVASTGLNYQGIDYFMMPSLRSLGFSVKFQF